MNPSLRTPALLIPFLLGSSMAAQAAPSRLSPPSAIVEVTVFADRAEVTREVKGDLAAGGTTVSIEGLPWGIEPDSLRVTAKGVPATLGAVELKERVAEPAETAELVAARGEVERLEGALRALDAEQGTDEQLREFLLALKATTATRESERMGEGRADPASIQAAYALVRDGLLDLGRAGVARHDRRGKINKELQVARARMQNARPAGPMRSRAAVVEVIAERPGPVTLRLTYVAPGAGWRPAYRASLDPETGGVALASEAVVRQRTGEDWSGVALRLSTAAPARGVTPPSLDPWFLRPVDVGLLRKEAPDRRAAGGMAPPQSPSAISQVLTAEAADEQESGAARQEAAVVSSAYNVAFEVPGRSDVLADGEEHRVGLRQEALEGALEYRSVPGLNEAAFLVARLKAPQGYPLLAGPARAFVSGAYLGSFHIAETAPDGEVVFPFGVDNRIKVDRTPLPQARSEEGVFGKERRLLFRFRTVVENLRDRNATVLLEDRIPVSEDERVVVERGRGTTPGAREIEGKPGVVEWALTLAPREKREVMLEYAVRFPRELRIPGLE